LSDFTSILDFGCGCGRLTRYLRPAGGQRVTGCDIDPESIGWCSANLAGAGVEYFVNAVTPPLPRDGACFDLVIAVSVFSHLPEDLQFAWLHELARVIRPGGLLVASVHGETLLPEETPTETRARLRETGFLYARGFGTPGLPDFYQTAYHRPEYVAAHWQKGFELKFGLPRGINNQQDAYVLARTATD
jgi:SAM-dependent methyltransferase